jgi:Di-haem oxidoreductase, putative peroxidase
VRNGSGIPIKPGTKMLDVFLQGPPGCQGDSCFMTAGAYDPYLNKRMDYTFTGTIQPMKLVFFDLKRRTSPIDPSVYDKPLGPFSGLYYSSKIMNYYGDSFHVTQGGYDYSWDYGTIPTGTDKPFIQVVDTSPRTNNELRNRNTYTPWQVNLSRFTTPGTCSIAPVPEVNGVPNPNLVPVWPSSTNNCADINDAALTTATNVGGGVGFMLLNGRRLGGNLGAIEAISNVAILGFQATQINQLVKAGATQALANAIAGQILWKSGTLGGIDYGCRETNDAARMACEQKNTMACATGSNLSDGSYCNNKLNCSPTSAPALNCYIGRFGWLGDSVSLDDQVANAAFIEMNMTSSTAFAALYPGEGTRGGNDRFPIRYSFPNCGLANQACINSKGNGDLSETDIGRMAQYARWLGGPTRSEFTVSLPEVIAGEQIFRDLQCNTCHVIDKIAIPPTIETAPTLPTMLPPAFRTRSAIAAAGANPFLSYLGTDLLMHDMGYLSQVAYNPSATIRDTNTGVVLNGCPDPTTPKTPTNPPCLGYQASQDFSDYVQKIRTPALKGLRFNRFVTGSFSNTIGYINPPVPSGNKPDPSPPHKPACDFLLHDGRACDAIQAAFLHDGPEIKTLRPVGPTVPPECMGNCTVIQALSKLGMQKLQNLRAFLYSL